MAAMTPDERFSLINENLQEVLNADLIKNILAEGKNPRVYWGECSLLCAKAVDPELIFCRIGTAPTSAPHVAYL